jgi:hypothetical protein
VASCSSLLPSTESLLLAPRHSPTSPRPGSPTAYSLPPSALRTPPPMFSLLTHGTEHRPSSIAGGSARSWTVVRSQPSHGRVCHHQPRCDINARRTAHADQAGPDVGRCHTPGQPRTEPMIAKQRKCNRIGGRRDERLNCGA